jgi:hypothetical protein
MASSNLLGRLVANTSEYFFEAAEVYAKNVDRAADVCLD